MDNFEKQVQFFAKYFKAANVELFEDGAILHRSGKNVITIAYCAWRNQSWVRFMTPKVFAQMVEDANSVKARVSLPVFAHIYDYGLFCRHRINHIDSTYVLLDWSTCDCFCLGLNGSESDVKDELKRIADTFREEVSSKYQQMNKVGHPDREPLFVVEQDYDDFDDCDDDCVGAVFTDYLAARDAIMARRDAKYWRIRPIVPNKFRW